MEVASYVYSADIGWNKPLDSALDSDNTLIIYFGTVSHKLIKQGLNDLKTHFPNSISIGCSSAGEVYADEMLNNSLAVAVCCFSKTKLVLASQSFEHRKQSFETGESLAQNLHKDGLRSVLVLSEGLNIDGSDLVAGMTSILPDTINISGGLAADDGAFEQTWVGCGFNVMNNSVIAVGFYGEHLAVSTGSKGGWDVIGIDRRVTRSIDNVLFELDNKPALALYKKYLGEKAKELPFSGLLFPLAVQSSHNNDIYTVLTTMGVNEQDQSIIVTRNISEGSVVNLMHGNIDHLIEGAYQAAEESLTEFHATGDTLCLVISCMGRKQVLGMRNEEELEAVSEVLPNGMARVGFYSHGEISPLAGGHAVLHNQTMTLTLLGEC